MCLIAEKTEEKRISLLEDSQIIQADKERKNPESK